MKRILALLLLVCSAPVFADDISVVEGARIEYILASIESLTSAQFVRNGTAYDAKAAVGHLRTKLRSAGSRVKTAEDFIELCATRSSMSGTPYEIRFADGRVILSAVFFRQKLREYAAHKAKGEVP